MLRSENKTRTPDFLVLLASYNGARFIGKQLNSIAVQTVPHVDVLVSDDGSTDETLALVREAAMGWTKGTVEESGGPCDGFAENFRHLVRLAPDRDFYAFCDQDDVWHPDKLARALAWLTRQDADRPALYCTRTRLIDADDRPIGLSPLFDRPPGFRNALVQSLAGGNTMVMNAAAFRLLRASLKRTPILMHDWWTYLIVSGAGGAVHYDPIPSLDYRQHAGNAIGGGLGPFARLRRVGELLAGRYVRWSDENIAALERCRDLLTEDSRAAVDAFKSLRRHRYVSSTSELNKLGLYRQTSRGNVALQIAAFIGKL